ncbi:hypothetical protein [Falsiruegeria litorea]|uniref:hypothetical protein n=1 Tax=Falsiruegeria litorea TaxID=1280831 RepID=UPI001BFE706D|nr:hypothetical protein [Falsiruegeria litorea]MBT8169895.1 hypothetical protein [Falsiruegeria litorea]
MAKDFAQAQCARFSYEPVSLERLTDATDVARQIVARDGPRFQHILSRLERELQALQHRLSQSEG